MNRATITLSLLCLFLCFGCAPLERGVSPHDIHRANELIDQGVLLLRAGQLDQAEASFAVAQEIADFAAALDGLGCIALLRGNYTRAERLFRRAYEMDDSYDHVLGNLALLYEMQGDRAQAKHFYKHALSDNPKSFRFRNNFAIFLYENDLENRERIIYELEKAFALANDKLMQQNMKRVRGN